MGKEKIMIEIKPYKSILMPWRIEIKDLEDIVVNDISSTNSNKKIFFRIQIQQEELEKIPLNTREFSLLLIYDDLTSRLTEYDVNYMERKKDDVFYVFINKIKNRKENPEEAKPWIREMKIDDLLK